MRFLVYPDKFLDLGAFIPDNCNFFQVLNDSSHRFDWLCVVSDDDRNIKCYHRNKSLLLYIDYKFNIEVPIKLKKYDSHSKHKLRNNFMGYLDLNSWIFSKNKDYTGPVSIIKTIEFLNESIRTR